jgi:hypothetical protein
MFSKSVINYYADSTTTEYTCERCINVVRFYISDFDKHWESDFTNLRDEDYLGSPPNKSFLDFYCPKCEVPTTIIFKVEAGGRNGEYRYLIESTKYS